MKRKGFLVLGLVALSSLTLQASGSKQARLLDPERRMAVPMAQSGEFGYVGVVNDNGAKVVEAGWWAQTDDVASQGDGLIRVADFQGNFRVVSIADAREGGIVGVLDSGGQVAAYMDASTGFWSKHGDVAENFPASVGGIAPGSVLVLDSENPGFVTLSTEPYDRRVAGVVSGADDYRPGLTLGSREHAHGVPVTLTGTVYCRVTNANGAIRAGDLLTTSVIPGHAMKATDVEKSRGATLGKAMQNFDEASGLIMVLASLQ